jgi:serine phosphatase RsbU (regulator of sigma subunit)
MSTLAPVRGRDEGRDVRLLTAQLDVLGGIVAGVPLAEALSALLEVVESVSPAGVLGSVLTLDPDGGHLRHCAAPSLPADYNDAIDGVAIGPSVGSCGTAAHRRAQVIVEDVVADPLWTDFRDLAVAAGLRACWSTPIFGSDGALLGTFAMYYPQPQRPSAADLALIDVLVRTVAMAIERSRADEERENALAAERAAALTLQHSLLPQVPAWIGPVQLAAHYRSGDPGVEVGGDWFEALPVADGLVVVVGDVQGHDLAAAALTGQLRTVARTYAAEGLPPSSVLAGVGRYLSRLDTDLLATALVVQLDDEARVAAAASAGHLVPSLLTPDPAGGWVVTDLELDVGPPLGIGEAWPERTSVLPGGSVLLLYTDGLVETRAWSIEHGLRALHDALAAVPRQAGLGGVLDAALDLVPSGLRGDDVAVLAAAVPAGVRPRATTRWLPPLPVSAPIARSWACGVLQGWDVPAAVVDDAVLLVSELVTNAVRHSERAARVTVRVPEKGGEVVVEVFDDNERLPRLPGAPSAGEVGGLQVVDLVSTAWGVREQPQGKTVWARLAVGTVRPAAPGR